MGFFDSVGNDIILSLTSSTTPKLDDKLRQIANDFAVGKFRFEVDNDDKLLQEAYKRVDHYLDHKFGWVTEAYRVNTTITLSSYSGAAGSTITITGENFRKARIIIVYFDNLEQTTTPTQVVTSTSGKFPSSGTVQLTIPAGTSVGSYEIKIVDGANDDPDLQASLTTGTPKGSKIIAGATARFTVTS